MSDANNINKEFLVSYKGNNFRLTMIIKQRLLTETCFIIISELYKTTIQDYKYPTDWNNFTKF